MPTHKLMGDKLNLYKRDNSRFWQCSTFLEGRNRRTSTKEESLAQAKEFAEDWFIDLHAKARTGTLKTGKTFAAAAKVFEKEYEASTRGHRSPKWVQGHKDRIRLHLMPYFGNKVLSGITEGAIQEYRVHRNIACTG